MKTKFCAVLCSIALITTGCFGGGGGGGSADGGAGPVVPGGNGNAPFGEDGSGNAQVDRLFLDINQAGCDLLDRCLQLDRVFDRSKLCWTLAFRMMQGDGESAAASVEAGRTVISQAELTAYQRNQEPSMQWIRCPRPTPSPCVIKSWKVR